MGNGNSAVTAPNDEGAKLGTFAGVFTPSILTILGIILFLRLGYVVGNAGLGGALVIIGIATAVSALTSVSLAAISTNIEVKGGGDYYLISRTLGLEFGGAIGIVLYLAQSVSVAFYAIGFAEAVTRVVGIDETWVVQLVAFVAVAALFVVARAGADVATRFQFVIMGVLILALASFYFGALGSFEPSVAGDGFAAPTAGAGFWIVFGIFFPAVTGFTQGVSMSGDLRTPSYSLPIGTFAAVGLSTVVYVTAAILLAGTNPLSDLLGDTGQAMQEVALIGPLIILGVAAATLSSAMASFLGAPRIIQSLASDRIFPLLNPLAQGVGPANNPRRAVTLSFVIAVATIGLGSLNVVAPIVSMFFLISYGLLNYATYFEARANSPAFRPRFKYFNKWLSLAGALACLGAMLAINVIAGGVAVLILFAVYRYLATRPVPERWGDASYAHHFQRAKENIAALSAEMEHPRDWRPQILVFSADPDRRGRLLRFAKWLEGDSGLTAAFRLVQGHGAVARKQVADEEQALNDQIRVLGLDVYGRAILVSDGLDALPVVVQSFGLGRVDANITLFGWPESPDPVDRHAYVNSLRDIARLGVNVVALWTDRRRWDKVELTPEKERSILVVWSDGDTGRLALLAAYLCTRTSFWGRATIEVLGEAGEGEDPDLLRNQIARVVEEARIPAEVRVLVQPDADDIVEAGRQASMVLLPMRIRGQELLDRKGHPLDPMMRRLPMTAALLAGTPIDLFAQPDSGEAARLAEAEESVDEARRRLAILERHLAEQESHVEVMAAADPTHPDYQPRLDAAEKRLDDLFRRTAKARARLESAEALVADLLHAQR